MTGRGIPTDGAAGGCPPPGRQICSSTFDRLVAALDVEFRKLAECLVSPGWRLSMPASAMPSIHYNLLGTGRMLVEGEAPISLSPHTLVIIPPGRAFHIDALDEPRTPLKTVVIEAAKHFAPGALRRCVAGEDEPEIMLVCGYFRAVYGVSIDLFGAFTSIIVEQFDSCDRVDQQLKAALSELVAQEIGMGAMTGILLKQVLVTLLRRSANSLSLWVERFPVLSDPQVSRAFAEMVSRPGEPHNVNSLAQVAGVSRSAFMARFRALFGQSPMAVLRDLRMKQAVILLNVNVLSHTQIAHEVGYESYSGFLRAFRKVYGEVPQDLLKE